MSHTLKCKKASQYELTGLQLLQAYLLHRFSGQLDNAQLRNRFAQLC